MEKHGNIQPKGKKKKKRSFLSKIGIFLLILCCVLLFLGILVVAGYFWMQNRGKNRLAEKQEALSRQITMSSVSANEIGEEEAEEETLKDGEIRYQGKTWTYKENMMTFLCMGIDKSGEMTASEDLLKGGQADALFLVALDPDEKTISIIGINRDTMTEISVYDQDGLYIGKRVAQIALQHGYGDGMEESCERTVEAVSYLFYGLPIHGYCAVNLEVISLINDAVGGVDVTLSEDLYVGNKLKWSAGEQVHLDGEDAFLFVKYRDTSVAESAEGRLERQKQYLQAFIAQTMRAITQDMTLLVQLYSQITPYMVTDISLDEVVYLAGQALSYSFDSDAIYTLSGEVVMGEKYEEFYQDDTALYELILKIFYEEVT